jgi:hypothetical protein
MAAVPPAATARETAGGPRGGRTDAACRTQVVRLGLVSSVALLLALLTGCRSYGSKDLGTPTRYAQSTLRLEARFAPPYPEAVKDGVRRGAAEQALAQAGVQARWIQMVTHWGSPVIANPYLPGDDSDTPAENERLLKDWVDEIHQAGMAAMSWYPLSFSKAAWQKHPEWRQVSLLPWQADGSQDIACCFNSPYGDALINTCNYAIETLGLDGIWFDGSAWTPIWNRPLPLTCACAFCTAKFKAETGLDLPAKADWNDPVFRRWVGWRYAQFGGFIGKLAAGIRAAHPQAAVVINHYHRPGIPWHSAIPIDLYAADIISGSEAFSPDTVDLTVRLCRAYNRPQAEVWRMFDLLSTPAADADRLLQHALIAYCAGGQPSFGGDCTNPNLAPTAALMTPVMNAIRPFTGGPSLRYAALHVSQQTETFHFARGGSMDNPGDVFWSALGSWTAGLGESHLPVDYVYDADLTATRLRGYRVLLLPLSQAITTTQAETALAFARQGGTLLLGLGAGQLDAEGEARSPNPLGQALGFAFSGVPKPDGADPRVLTLASTGGRPALTSRGMFTPMRLTAEAWKPLWQSARSADRADACVAHRRYGKGHVVILNVDPTVAVGSTPCAEGDTRLEVTDGVAASGRYALTFVDGPRAPQPFYPDLENRLPAFGTPDYRGGELSCDLRLEPTAQAAIEIRSSAQPIAGPIVTVGPNGRIACGDQVLCEAPPNQWLHLRIAYTFAQDGQPAQFTLTATLPDGTAKAGTFPCPAPGYQRTDWFVIYGPGAAGTFYLDNLELARTRADGSREVLMAYDFEEGPTMFQVASSLARNLGDALKTYAPPPLELEAPPQVRLGAFTADGERLLVHLHNRLGTLPDWQQPTGPAAALRCRFRVRAATLQPSGTALPVSREGDEWVVKVPAVGLYQVVELHR